MNMKMNFSMDEIRLKVEEYICLLYTSIRNIHIKPYEMAVRNTEVKAVMTSYNSWNGIPNSCLLYTSRCV